MIFHFSIAAHHPHHVAAVIAELWDGDALFFPPISDDAWIVIARDDRRSAMEIYPIDTVLREVEGDADARGEATGQIGFTATHAAIATSLTQEQVTAIAARECWPVKYRKRGGMFGVLELWIEGRQMMEILTPEMQGQYCATMSASNWRAMLAGVGAATAIA
jgi:hypothetical protein